jgi:hypothetical protein
MVVFAVTLVYGDEVEEETYCVEEEYWRTGVHTATQYVRSTRQEFYSLYNGSFPTFPSFLSPLSYD